MSTFVISCESCGQESGWVCAEMAGPEMLRDVAKAKKQGRKVELVTGEKYTIGKNPMFGSKDCRVCGSKAENPKLFAEVV